MFRRNLEMKVIYIFLLLYLLPDNFRQVQIKTNCRQHFKVHLTWKISNFPFSHSAFDSYISEVHQNVLLCGNGLLFVCIRV